MLTIWGRANSINVMKVLWLCEELGLPFKRIDAGLEHGRVQDPDYLAMNPNARVPTIVEADGFTLWESNSICRYLCRHYAENAPIYPGEARARADVEKWMDWQLQSLSGAMTPLFWGHVRTPPEKRDHVALAKAEEEGGRLWTIVDQQLKGKDFLCGGLTLADLIVGPFVHRWYNLPVQRPSLLRLDAWYARLRTRPGYARYVAGVKMT